MSSLAYLHPDNVGFPNPELALSEPEGLLAAGGDLTPEWLVEAYASGIFPWFERDEDPIYWWSPAERAVMRPGCMRVTRSLSKRIRNAGFRVSFDCIKRSMMRWPPLLRVKNLLKKRLIKRRRQPIEF